MNTRIIILIGFVVIAAGCKYAPVKRAPGPEDFTEQDVKTFITLGQPVSEITNRFGVPYLTKTNQFNQVIMRFHSGLPDTIRTNGYVFAGFHLVATNGTALRWSASEWQKDGLP